MRIDTVEAADGYRLRHRVWPAAAPRATLVMLNGVMSNSAWFEPIAGDLVARGIELVGADRRGSGPNDEARGDTPSADALIDDAVRIAEAHRADRPMFLLGWCWGAVLALNVIHRIDANGLILVASGLHPTASVSAAAAEADAADGDRVLIPIREEMFTRGPALEGFIRRDDARLSTVTRRFRSAMNRLAMTAAGRMRKVAVPVLSILATNDEATDSDVAASALKSASVVRIEGPHGLMFDAPDALASAIASFVEGESEAR